MHVEYRVLLCFYKAVILLIYKLSNLYENLKIKMVNWNNYYFYISNVLAFS